MNPTTHSREYREGWIGRRRTYRCRQCSNKFQVDTVEPLPNKKRICPKCKADNHIAVRVANNVGNWGSMEGGDAKQNNPAESTAR